LASSFDFVQPFRVAARGLRWLGGSQTKTL
jgi:hypothetical protein